MEDFIYLDNAATTKALPEIKEDIYRCLEVDFGNPSSLHIMGLKAQRKIKETRNKIANFLGVSEGEIFFTSGGTESNNLAIIGSALAKKGYGKHCITTEIEHPSVINTFKFLQGEGFDITFLPVNDKGIVDTNRLKESIREDTTLVSIAHINSEIGSVQPIEEIGKFLKKHYQNVIFHSDGVQSFGKVNLWPKDWGVDLLSISGHKIHGPKGIGALYKRRDIFISPLQWGGGQEKGLRSGTENLPGIVGLGRAVQYISERMRADKDSIRKMKVSLAEAILEEVPGLVFIGPDPAEGAPHILSISAPNLKGETLLHILESHGVFVSTGSACSSQNKGVSHVLKAIGLSLKVAEGAIRLSLSYMNTADELGRVPRILKESINEIKGFSRR